MGFIQNPDYSGPPRPELFTERKDTPLGGSSSGRGWRVLEYRSESIVNPIIFIPKKTLRKMFFWNRLLSPICLKLDPQFDISGGQWKTKFLGFKLKFGIDFYRRKVTKLTNQ